VHLRIGHVTYSYHPITGGGDTYLEQLRRVLADAGHDQRVYQRPVEGDVPEHVRLIPDRLGSILGRAHFWTVPYGLGALRRELEREDVLIAHYPNYHRAVEWHPRTVLISHGVFWDDGPGSLRSRIKRRIARRAYRLAGRVVANDTFYLREMGVDAPVGTEPFSEVEPGRWFVPNCVDTERFRPCEPIDDLAALSPILVPRNLFRNRGIHLAIVAFARIASGHPEVHLVVVGADSQPRYRAECERLAEGLGVSDRVVFRGPAPWEDMPRIYSSGLLTVIPSLCGEGTSLAALESMACGTPVVTTALAGLLDLPCRKAEPEPEALATAMEQALSERDSLADEQRSAVLDTYCLSRWAEAWLGIVGRLAP